MGKNKEELGNPSGKKKNLRDEQIRRKRILAKRRKRKIKRMILAFFITIVVLIVGSFIYAYRFIGGLKTNTLGNAIDPGANEAINILVLGMDIGDTENINNKAVRRTDTIMVVNYNPNTKKVHIVSVPRDTMIEVDAYVDDGSYQRYWKINAAYALGGEEEVIKHISSILKVNINYLVEVDYNAFRGLVDAVDGVEMQIDQNMFYDDDLQNLHINFKAGETVLLDGQKAEEFFRWRKNNDGSGLANGDIDRIKNQQQFMSKLIEKCLKPSVVFKVPKILDVISKNVETNMPAKKILGLGLKVLSLKKSDIIMTTVKGESEKIYGQDYLVVDKESNKDLINTLNSSNLSNGSVLTDVKRENLKIAVLNGTKVNGLAGGLQSDLYKIGYVMVETGNSQVRDKSVIQVNNKELKSLLESDTGINNFEKISMDEYKGYDAVIILGKDYNLFGN
ncbi:LCP family protein [Clostridium carnis]